MAMLAERKRKEKWCLNPRGKSWSADKNKFGQRLLEKMGWSEGQGLGLNNQGQTEIVKVRKKDDIKGFGFKENGEEWLKTTCEFNELLDQLGNSSQDEHETSEEPKSALTSSLEDRSKQSKARVHYHKFTRGKDLSKYSEKDLAQIIGPEVVKAKSNGESEADYTTNQINKGSSEDYFNKKDPIKQKNVHENEEELIDNEMETSNNDVPKKKKNKKSKNKEAKSSNSESEEFYSDLVDSQPNTDQKNECKSKKTKTSTACIDLEDKQTEESANLDTDNHSRKKKKKLKKQSIECEEIESNNSSYLDKKNEGNQENETSIQKKKKKKDKKSKKDVEQEVTKPDVTQSFSNLQNTGNVDTEYGNNNNESPKKRKKQKQDTDTLENDDIEKEKNIDTSTKKKKSKNVQIQNNNVCNSSVENKKESKKRKRKLEEESSFDSNEPNHDGAEKCVSEIALKKKKKVNLDSVPVTEESIENEQQTQETPPKQLKKCLEVLGRRTRLNQINNPHRNQTEEAYTTTDFMTFNNNDFENKISQATPKRFQPLRTDEVNNYEQMQPHRMYIVPNKHDCDIPKQVITQEYRLLSKKFKERNISIPQVKVIIKFDPKMLSKATTAKLKTLHKSRHMKTLIPKSDVEEVETSVKEISEKLQPKVEAMKVLSEIEVKTSQLALEMAKKSEDNNLSDGATPIVETKKPEIEKLEALKKMSKELKKIVINEPETDIVQEAIHENMVKSTEENETFNNDSSEKAEFDAKKKFQARLQDRLKYLSKQMKLMKKGKLSEVDLPKEINDPIQNSFEEQSGFYDQFHPRGRGSFRSYSRGARGITRFQNSSSQGQENGSDSRKALPFRGWGVLRSFEVPEDADLRGYFRGNFRGRGRRGMEPRGRGRISQNNHDAKIYAEKCKAENKLPELSFNGVDLKNILGYASAKKSETNKSNEVNPSKSEPTTV